MTDVKRSLAVFGALVAISGASALTLDEFAPVHKAKVERWGAALALMTWLPFVGDLFAIVLGFYKARFVPSALWMFVGKCGRFVVWALLYIGLGIEL